MSITAEPTATTDAEQPRGKPIGLAISTALVAGTIIGSGIFTLPAALAGIGWIAIVGFFISSVGATAVIPEATMQATLMHSSSMAQR